MLFDPIFVYPTFSFPPSLPLILPPSVPLILPSLPASLPPSSLPQTLLSPASSSYQKLAEDCVKFGVSVELFLFPSTYCDVATLGHLTSTTGGELHYYRNYQVSLSPPPSGGGREGRMEEGKRWGGMEGSIAGTLDGRLDMSTAGSAITGTAGSWL